MDVILKFASLRGRSGAAGPALSLASESDFQRRLADGAAGERPTVEMKAAARAFAETEFVRTADQVANGPRLVELVQRLQAGWLPTPDRLASDIRQAIHAEDRASFASDAALARDSVLTRYLLPDGPGADVAVALTRGYALADAVLGGSPTAETVAALVHGPMALPDFIVELRDEGTPAPAAPAPSPEESARALAEQINSVAARRQQLAQTLEHIGFHAEDELDVSEFGGRRPLRELSDSVGGGAEGPGRRIEERVPVELGREVQAVSQGLRAAARRNVVLSSRALELMPDQVTETLRSLDLDPTSASLFDIHTQTTLQHHAAGLQLTALAGKFAHLGNEFAHFIDPSLQVDPVDAPDIAPAANTTPPKTHTPVKPLGVADLLLVRAHISHYERAEIAAIENTISHEKLTHSSRRLDSVDALTTDETESSDLRSQTQGTAENNNGHTTVQAVGPGVGPLAAEGASSFAKSVTDQVSSSATNRARRLSTLRHLRESEETFEHLIDNTPGPNSVYGVYQWLDKIYQAQVFSYGSRLLYDVVVPEPAAVFRDALGRPRSGLLLPVKPAKFALAPSRLTLDNWDYYATGHHASGVEAPPPDEVVVSESFAGRSKDQFSNDAVTNTFLLSEARTTRIPKGYSADRFKIRMQVSGCDTGMIEVAVGIQTVRVAPANGNFFRTGRLDGEVESLPVAIHITSDGVNWGVLDATVSVEIICTATEELTSAWQVRTHARILEANQNRFADYAEAIATRDASARIFLQTLPAPRKTSIIQTEVKRTALELLTGQAFTGFNATGLDASGFPSVNIPATVGLSSYIRFFEQAVEWEHLAYAFYPYFWGAQTSWVSKLLINETDHRFMDFLTSGAARVVLPIRPGYEAAFETFLNTGTVPSTAELLDVGSKLWVSLVAELRAGTNPEGEETAVNEPWQFRIASELVRARTDGSMPKWAFAQGTWQDAADPNF
jgi:hypothetical protein